MKIAEFLAPGNVLTEVRAADKIRLLHDLSMRAAAALGIDGDVVAEALIRRERLGSTGVGGGVAIPHARLAAIRKPFGLMARLKKPIDFEAIDGQPVDLVFVLLLPAAASDGPLNALASAARRLREPETLRALREGADPVALFQCVTG